MSSSGPAAGPIFNPEWYAPLWNGYPTFWLETLSTPPARSPRKAQVNACQSATEPAD